MGSSELGSPGWEHVGDVDVESTYGEPAATLGQPPADDPASDVPEVTDLCDQRAAGREHTWVCTQPLGHDDNGWHRDPVAGMWWKQAGGAVAVAAELPEAATSDRTPEPEANDDALPGSLPPHPTPCEPEDGPCAEGSTAVTCG